MQAWALQQTLESMGHEVVFPNCGLGGDRRSSSFPRRRNPAKQFYHAMKWGWQQLLSLGFYDLIRFKTEKWRTRNLNTITAGVNEFACDADVVVVGSDQVWNVEITHADDGLYLCDDISDSMPKIAYAVSVGDGVPSNERIGRIVKAARRFNAVSVREGWLADILNSQGLCGKCATMPDPTLLLSASEYERVAAPRLKRSPYLFVYALAMTPSLYLTAKRIAKQLGVKCVMTSVYERSKASLPWDVMVGVSPDEFLSYIRDAAYVIAASFHGTVFSLIYGKKFLSWRSSIDSMESRQASLLRECGLLGRLVEPSMSFNDMLKRMTEDVPALRFKGKVGVEWLKKAIVPLSDSGV